MIDILAVKKVPKHVYKNNFLLIVLMKNVIKYLKSNLNLLSLDLLLTEQYFNMKLSKYLLNIEKLNDYKK